MSNILVDDSQKGNKCCSRSIDIERGCANQCIGCYGTKTSLMGTDKYFNHVVSKEFDENKFRNSCKGSIRKGYPFARLGKHSDCGHGHLTEVLKPILKIATEEGLRLVFVSKSLVYDEEIAKLLIVGNHILHMSLGMITQAPSDLLRLRVYRSYKKAGVNSKLRLVDDITKEYNGIAKFCKEDMIITPMRFTSKDVAEQYKADLSKYEWTNGYYRPKEMHKSWNKFTNWCGEVNNEVKCCNCLTGE